MSEGRIENGAPSPQGGAPHRLVQAARTDRELLARSSITFFSRGFAKFAQIFFLVVAARLLTVEEFAAYSYLIVLASAFTILSDTGVPLVAGRDASAGREQLGELFRSALPIVAVSAIVTAALLPIFGAIDSGPGSSFVPVMIAALFVVFNRFFELICQLLRGVGRFTLEAALQFAGAASFIAGAIGVLAAGYGVTAVIAVLCLKELTCCVVGYAAIRADLRPAGRGRRPSNWRRLLSIGIRLSVAGIALALAMRLPLAVLGNTGTPTEVALFSAAQRFGDGAYVLAITGGFALLPGIAYLARAERLRAQRLSRRVLLGVIGVGAALSTVAIPLAEPIMRVIFGGRFEDGADLFRIVIAGLPAYTVLGVCWYAIVAFDGESRLLGVGVTSLALSAAMSVIVIPMAGDRGAAWTYLASMSVSAVLSFLALERQLRIVSAPVTLAPVAEGTGAPGMQIGPGP